MTERPPRTSRQRDSVRPVRLFVPVLLLGLTDQAVGARMPSSTLAALVICTALVGLTLGRSSESGPLTPTEDPRD